MNGLRIDLTGKVAIVTGAGGGLGREHALLLARRGARVVVNDLGGARDGQGRSFAMADAVVDEIRKAGGEAMANAASVTDEGQVAAMVDETLRTWGRIDILVNNAGILRDRTFAKLDLADFRAVVEVHLMGSATCTKAVWEPMREQGYGRIVLTTSSSGLWGNFGQAPYAAAKMGLVGLMKTLKEEGARYGIHVNCLAPSAATRMTADIMTQADFDALDPSNVAPGVLALVAEQAPSGLILCAGAGNFEAAHITMTRGCYIGDGEDAAERVLASLARITDRDDDIAVQTGMDQPRYELARHREHLSPQAIAAND